MDYTYGIITFANGHEHVVRTYFAIMEILDTSDGKFYPAGNIVAPFTYHKLR